MVSRKRKATASRPREPYDTTRFISEGAWERYAQNVHSQNFLPERNIILYISEYDKFRWEFERWNWHKALTRQLDGHIDVALVKEFYANLYDLEDKSPRQVKVRGKLIKFDAESLNAFLETPVILEPGSTTPLTPDFVIHIQTLRSLPLDYVFQGTVLYLRLREHLGSS